MSSKGVHSDSSDGRALDRRLKHMAQRYYEACIGTREEFIKEFTKSYMDDEK